MKSVCILNRQATGLYFPDHTGFTGGAEVDLYQIARILKLINQDVHVIVDFPDGVSQHTTEDGIILHPYPEHVVSGPFRTFRALRRLWKSMLHIPCDIYFAKIQSPVTALLAIFSRVHGKTFLYRAASGRDVTMPLGIGHRVFREILQFWVIKTGLSVCLTQTDEQYKAYQHVLRKDKILRHIPNVHLENRSVQADLHRKSHILWVGHLTDVKQPDEFISLARQMPEFKLVMIAANRDPVKSIEFRRKTAEIENLEFHENVPFESIQPYFDRALFLVNTSLREGFPNTFIQAFQALTPIATLHVDPDRLIQDRNIGVSADTDVALAQLIKETIQSKVRYQEIQARIKLLYEERYSSENVISRYKELFGEIS